MAFCVFNLSKHQRQLLYYVLGSLLALMIGCGIFLVGYSVYMCFSISSSLFSERSELNYVFMVVGLIGTHIIFIYALGFTMLYKCLRQTMKKSTRSLLFLWYLAGTNSIVDLIVICNATRKEMKHVIKSMKRSMEKGMQIYLKDDNWKQTIDKLQYKLKCCGVNGYLDWHETLWIDKLKTSHEHLHLPITPWSCCRVDFPMQCLHDPFQQIQSTYLWVDQPDLVLQSINNSGCLNLLQSPVQLALFFIVLTSIFTFILNIVIIVLSRILYTSCRNSILLNDNEGIAPGWIFGRGDCGYTRGQSLTEMVTIESSAKPKKKEKSKKVKTHTNETSQPNMIIEHASDEDPVSSGEESQLLL